MKHIAVTEDDLGALLDALADRDAVDAARGALYALDAEDADLVPALVRELARRPPGEARIMIVRALGQIGAAAGSGALAGCLTDADVWICVHALISLATVGWTGDALTTAIATLAADATTPMQRIGALGALAAQRDDRAAGTELARMAREAPVGEASWSLEMLCKTSAYHAWALDHLVALLDHWSDEFRETIALTLREHPPAATVPRLLAAGPRDGGVFLALRELGERARPWAPEVTTLLAQSLVGTGPLRAWALRTLHGAAVERDRIGATLDVEVARAVPRDLELEGALERDVCAHPEDRDARARFGRYLDANGDPRGDAIRCALAVPPAERRLSTLIETYGNEWTDRFPPAHYLYKLGLPWHASVADLDAFAAALGHWFPAEHPIASLALTANGNAAALHKVLARWLPRPLLDLAITGAIDEAALDLIARAPRLRSLALALPAIDDAVRALVDRQAPIVELALAPAPRDAVIEALCCGALPRLRVLVLPGPIAPAIVALVDDPETVIEVISA